MAEFFVRAAVRYWIIDARPKAMVSLVRNLSGRRSPHLPGLDVARRWTRRRFQITIEARLAVERERLFGVRLSPHWAHSRTGPSAI
jgi:hypothetical protein